MASTTETLNRCMEDLEKSGMGKFMDDLFNNSVTPIKGQDLNALKQEVKEKMCMIKPTTLQEFLQEVEILIYSIQIVNKLFEGVTSSDGSVNVDDLKQNMIKKMASSTPENLEVLLLSLEGKLKKIKSETQDS